MDKILTLLQVANTAKNWPQLQAIHDIAMQELLEENEGAKQELADRAKAAAEKKAAAEAKVAQQQADDAEAQQKNDALLNRPSEKPIDRTSPRAAPTPDVVDADLRSQGVTGQPTLIVKRI